MLRAARPRARPRRARRRRRRSGDPCERGEGLGAGPLIAALREELCLELVRRAADREGVRLGRRARDRLGLRARGDHARHRRPRLAEVVEDLQSLVEVGQRRRQIRCALAPADVRTPDEQRRALHRRRPRGEEGVEPAALRHRVVAGAREQRASGIARELGRPLLRELVGALVVGARRGRLPGAIEQVGPSDRELRGAGVQAIASRRGTLVAGESDERHDRGVELGGRVIPIEGRLGELRQHRVRLCRGLAGDERGPAQAGASLVGALQREVLPGEGDLVLGRGVLRQAEAPQPLVELCGASMITPGGSELGESGDGIGLQRIQLEGSLPRGQSGDAGRVELRALMDEVAEGGPRARAGAVITARICEPRHVAPCIDGLRRLGRREDRGRHLGHRRILGRERPREGELGLRGLWLAEVMGEYVREAQA